MSEEEPEPKPGRTTGWKREPGSATDSADVIELRDLARRGALAATYAAATEATKQELRGTAYAVAHAVVFDSLTSRIEYDRGHHHCARSSRQLEPACLDRYYDDIESAVRHLLTRATMPIGNVEAWIAGSAQTAAVDGYRRRRGELGALQRPRMTKTLAAGLDHDRWLMDLALDILEWVGVTGTAGAGLWPLESWARKRAAVKGVATVEPAVVEREVEQILTVMREQPIWYAKFVERPLGRKVAPVGGPPGDGAADPRPLPPVPRHEVDDACLRDLAWTATEAIRIRLGRGDDPSGVVPRVLAAVFTGGAGGEELDRAPGTDPSHAERVSALLADPVALADLVDRVLRVLGHVEE